MYAPHLYPFLCRRTSRLLPCLGCLKQHCSGHWGACLLKQSSTRYLLGPFHHSIWISAPMPLLREPCPGYTEQNFLSSTACWIFLSSTRHGLSKNGFKLGSSKPEVVKSTPMMEALAKIYIERVQKQRKEMIGYSLKPSWLWAWLRVWFYTLEAFTRFSFFTLATKH